MTTRFSFSSLTTKRVTSKIMTCNSWLQNGKQRMSWVTCPKSVSKLNLYVRSLTPNSSLHYHHYSAQGRKKFRLIDFILIEGFFWIVVNGYSLFPYGMRICYSEEKSISKCQSGEALWPRELTKTLYFEINWKYAEIYLTFQEHPFLSSVRVI